MQYGSVKIRRGKRTDFPALVALLAPADQAAANQVQARHWRRLASDPAHDFYVAEQEDTLRGMVLVSYIRGLRHYNWQAMLDVVFPSPAACAISQALLDFAKARARKRGCQHLFVWVTDHAGSEQLAPLMQAGFHRSGEVLSCGLL